MSRRSRKDLVKEREDLVNMNYSKERWEEYSKDWLQRLMEIMKESNYIQVCQDNFFLIEIGNERKFVYRFPSTLEFNNETELYIDRMDEVLFEIETIKLKRKEEERRQILRREALSKLSKEEKEVLGL